MNQRFSAGPATATGGNHGNRGRSGNAPAVLHGLHQLGGLAEGKAIELAEDRLEVLVELNGLGFFTHRVSPKSGSDFCGNSGFWKRPLAVAAVLVDLGLQCPGQPSGTSVDKADSNAAGRT